MDNWTMGTTIAQLRKQAGMTQEALAKRMGVSNQAVSKWETDQCCPDVLLLPKLADTFEITIDTLFGRASGKQEPVVLTALPWEDNEDLHAACFVGHKLVGHEWVKRATGKRGGVLNLIFNKNPKAPEAAQVVLNFSGTVHDIFSDFAVSCDAQTTIQGNVVAGDGVHCGTVGGSVTAGDSVTCGAVGGNAMAGDGLWCTTIGGNAKAGDSISCNRIGGDAKAGDSVRCETVDGKVHAK